MYLKRIELQGFKSFPEKIKLDFNKGITAVVGPNGSGKSNVSDAIRWVLGEQSAKSLRGGKMEDIIFAGTKNRKPLGFAEVSMTIDNADHKLNVDFSELTVTRRVYRSGESQFSINNSGCRLKDIHELFMDTGIGREGYSIIGQGRIDEILSVKSEDRRLLFEEAAGIVKYKNRKHEAQTKLEREKQNLLRVNDIILELENQIEPLFVQSEKAKNYLALAEKLKLIDVNIFVREVRRFESELLSADENISVINNQIEAEAKAQSEYKARNEALKSELAQTEISADNKAAEIAELRSEFEKKESEIKLCYQKIEHIEADINRLNKDIISKREAIDAARESKTLYETKHNASNLEMSAAVEKLAIKQSEYDSLNEKLIQSEDLIDKYASEHIEKLRLTSDAEGKIQRAEALYEQLEQRKEELDEDKNYNASKINDGEIKLAALQKSLREQIETQDELKWQLTGLYNERDRLETESAEISQQLDQTIHALNDNTSRHKLLCELENSYEGYYKSVKAVLKQKKLNPGKFSGICGAVGELITVEEKYETAIEIALGGALQNIITNTEADAKSAIVYLKETKEGRATFLPITAIKGKYLGDIKDRLMQEPGIIGIGKELIGCDGKYEGIIANLLGKVIICDNIENAIGFSKKYSYQYKVVTLEGDLINPGGALTGGSVSKTQSNILSRSREIGKLESEIVRLSDEKDILMIKRDDTGFKLNSVAEKISKNKFIIREAEIQKASLSANIEQAQASLVELKEAGSDYEIEERQLMEQIVETNKDIRQLRENYAKIEKEIEDIINTMDANQSLLQGDKEKREALSKEITNIKVNISVISGNISSVSENINRIETDIKNNTSSILACGDEIIAQEKIKTESENKILEFTAEAEQIKLRQDQAVSGAEELSKQKEFIQQKIGKLEEDSISKLELISSLKNELTRLDMKKEQSEINNRRLFDEMWENYGITYQEAQKLPKVEESTASLERENKKIKAEMKDIGTVNVNAVEEYKAVKERYEFLSKQRNDIIEAEEKLKDIINELNALMEKQFYEQFQLISHNFGIVFSEMFGGGTAALKLSDENDVLESGIEIISQPPGKTLQNMMLLSGGERALTAIALLFAILRMKPSPFCILDEIEAALDDANVKRYANYLRNFSDDTQFIIITHRKGTMEAADVLYGVTMQEQGISKLVSVNFSQPAVSF